MRASGPYEVRPRQLRALVLLLALLPLLPMTFVVRFVAEDVANERREARERARPVLQQFLEATSAGLAANTAKRLTLDLPPGVDDPWRIIREQPSAADTVLLVSPEGRLSAPPTGSNEGGNPAVARAATLARQLIDKGVHYAGVTPTGRVRWRFLAEAPEPIFSLQPDRGRGEPSLLFIKTREHLVEQMATYYRRELDPQTAVRLVDESGESVPLAGSLDVAGAGGEPLGRVLLRPPLPAWQVEIYSTDATLVSGLAHDQIAFYWWSVAGMITATAAIAGVAGWALTRRISLHELSNDSLAMVSHEMKTPLASIRLLIETLLDRRYHGGADAADDYLRLIAGENARLERLVDSFQTLSRLESSRAGRTRLKLEPVCAGDIAEEASERLAARLEAEGSEFRLEGDLNAPPFSGNREALTAVLVNLLDNALKYSGEEKRIVLRTTDAPDRVTFEVSDNGDGIAPEEQSRIFERFYQSDNRLSRRHEGCGLGLNIVRSAVKAHGGSVSVQSVQGKGSTFTVCVPKAGASRDEPRRTRRKGELEEEGRNAKVREN